MSEREKLLTHCSTIICCQCLVSGNRKPGKCETDVNSRSLT